MPGHIRKLLDKDKKPRRRGDGTFIWQVRWRPPGDVTDTRRIEKVFRTKQEAERWLSTTEADALRGTYINPRKGEKLFSTVADEYRETWSRLAPKTRVGYESILRCHILPEFGSKKVAAIQAQHVQAFHNRLASTRAPNTVRRVMDVLRGVLALAVKRHYIASNPASTDNVELARRSRSIEINPLTHEEVDKLVELIDPHWRLPVLLDAYTGLRAGELWALRLRDLDPLRGELSITQAIKEVTTVQTAKTQDIGDNQRLTPSLIIGPTKTYAVRKVSVPAFLNSQLQEHISKPLPGGNDPAAFLFTTETGEPVREGNFRQRIFAPAARAALPAATVAAEARYRVRREAKGEPAPTQSQLKAVSPVRVHDLRHTCAAWLIAAGAHPLQIKLRLGHESIRTTMDTYGHLFPSAEPELAALLDQARSAATAPAPAPAPASPADARGTLGEMPLRALNDLNTNSRD